MLYSPVGPLKGEVTKVRQVEDLQANTDMGGGYGDAHLVDVDTDSDHVAANEKDDHGDEQHGNLLVPPLAAGHPAISIG